AVNLIRNRAGNNTQAGPAYEAAGNPFDPNVPGQPIPPGAAPWDGPVPAWTPGQGPAGYPMPGPEGFPPGYGPGPGPEGFGPGPDGFQQGYPGYPGEPGPDEYVPVPDSPLPP